MTNLGPEGWQSVEKRKPPRELLDLIARYAEHRGSYRDETYKEAQLRKEFIDPFLELLGWDVANRQGYAEAYKEVINEYAMSIGRTTKAPDYCFRIGGTRKFFLEAKKPSVNVKEDPIPSLQLRRYGWSAKLPLCILTNFEELAVFDTRIRPKKDDTSSSARIQYIKYPDLPRRWDILYRTFSKEAVLKGSFDKYAETEKDKKGTSEVDDAFLGEIEGWRVEFAKNIALRNPGLGQRDLNFAVQSTIDRLIFLRICEDRGIETYGRLQRLLEGSGVYDRIKEYYRLGEERYNSGLFHFTREKARQAEPDTIATSLAIDDKILKSVIKSLYYPESPYEFSIFPAEVLGQVYEQFLAKIIRLTSGHRAIVEERPELKKAGGVYYTPSYIVDYVVGTVLDKLLAGKTPVEAADLRIVDPACGSGSFLIGAYQYLLDWHLNWYVKDSPKKHRKEVFQGPGGSWLLTADERKRILLANIYGVDIDPQAVEVTKLSLLLKVLEQTSGETIDKNQKLFHERALPDLDQNVKCGNSLVAPDYYASRQSTLFDEENRLKINVFDWKAEFPRVFGASRKSPGFDAVIGNPPYVRQEALKTFKEYFETRYTSFDGVADLYVYFMEKAVSLLREGGQFSYIVSSSFLRTTSAENLRRFLKANAAVLRIVDFGGLPVFRNAKDTYVCIPHLSKGPQPDRVQICRVKSLDFLHLDSYVATNSYDVPQDRLSLTAWSLHSDEETTVFQKINRVGTPLGDYVNRRFFRGVTTGLNEAFIISSKTQEDLVKQDPRSAELIKPLLGGEDIRRWFYRKKDTFLIFTRRGTNIDGFPAIKAHLAKWKAKLTPRTSGGPENGRKPGKYEWYEIQDEVAYYKVFEAPKIIFPDIAKEPRFCLDRTGSYIANTGYCLGTEDLYLLGILNSQLFWFAISHISIPFGIRAGRYRYRLIYQYMEKVPIKVPDPHNAREIALHDHLQDLAGRIIERHEALEKSKNPQERTLVLREIAALDSEIDRVVFELYGLAQDEISIVERGNFKSAAYPP